MKQCAASLQQEQFSSVDGAARAVVWTDDALASKGIMRAARTGASVSPTLMKIAKINRIIDTRFIIKTSSPMLLCGSDAATLMGGRWLDRSPIARGSAHCPCTPYSFAKTGAGPSFPVMEKMVKGASFTPLMPGEPSGIPGKEMPLMAGFSLRSLLIGVAGTWPSTT